MNFGTWCVVCGDNRERTLFSWLHIYYARLVFVGFEHSLCRGSLMTTDLVMQMYNLIEYNDVYLKTSGSLWQYYKDEALDNSTDYK